MRIADTDLRVTMHEAERLPKLEHGPLLVSAQPMPRVIGATRDARWSGIEPIDPETEQSVDRLTAMGMRS